MKLTKKELKSINGFNGKVLIAYKKKIYDVVDLHYINSDCILIMKGE